MAVFELNQPELYINRELSVLTFNTRVLEQARDVTIPLLERLRFLLICDKNIDEFFEIRVAGLKQQIALGSNKSSIDGLIPQEALKKISEEAHKIIAEKYRIYNSELLPALRQENIQLLDVKDWKESEAAWTRQYFLKQVLPVLSPIGLDLAHPFPRVINESLNFIVELKGEDAFGRTSGLAIIHAPRSLPRIIALPSSTDRFVLLSSIICHYAAELFPAMEVVGCYQFRITRNSDFFVDEDKIDDLLMALKTQLLTRLYGSAVRLEVAENCPKHLVEILRKKTELEHDDIYYCQGPVNLNRLNDMIKLINRPDLRYPTFAPQTPKILKEYASIFDCLKIQDVLLQHPYQSFNPMVSFIQQAAYDEDVLAIKMTLYRTQTNSNIVNALIDAARSGKEVTVIIELLARFDEAENIALANQLQEAGALIAYGVVGFKTHAKMALVVRRENKELIRYAHLGTGNYHSTTATQYTDYGLLTSNPDITEDVHCVFQQLTGIGAAVKLNQLLLAPFTLHATLLKLVNEYADLARKGQKVKIIFKMNALTEVQIIQALYNASQAGVEIHLIVRGICCLRPGIQGVSDNIHVRSVIGRFLEHHRIYYFETENQNVLYLSSADMMERNCFHRVEVAFPILNEELRERIKYESFNLLLKDNCQSWELMANGEYRHLSPKKNEPPICAQQILLDEYTS